MNLYPYIQHRIPSSTLVRKGSYSISAIECMITAQFLFVMLTQGRLETWLQRIPGDTPGGEYILYRYIQHGDLSVSVSLIIHASSNSVPVCHVDSGLALGSYLSYLDSNPEQQSFYN